MKATLVGDIHGNLTPMDLAWRKYGNDRKIIQVGDFGFADTYHKAQHRAYAHNFIVVPGNHDDYHSIASGKLPQALGDFGWIPGTINTGYLRGAWSIDYASRLPGISWWSNEELSFEQCYHFLNWYEEHKPEVMISHETHPILCHVLNGNWIPSKTGQLIKDAFDIYKPERWYFGHHHKSIQYEYKGCEFTGLAIDELLEVDLP